MQNQRSPVAQTLLSSGDVSVLFALDLFSCYCALGEGQVVIKQLLDTCVSSVWR